ncbi:hypothetical protein BOO71_0011035 [Deinococcus marmoris]|uniref:Uncharacterized protein n=1 Tax=Deinococcus marmoris TaxID=249408 RepID=A0A1U7NUX2_9DEIO|nr:hypothetical protein BOO71_0011035 [Deinococcus marmoris]
MSALLPAELLILDLEAKGISESGRHPLTPTVRGCTTRGR